MALNLRFELKFSKRCITYTNPAQPFALPTELSQNVFLGLVVNVLQHDNLHKVTYTFEPLLNIDFKF